MPITSAAAAARDVVGLAADVVGVCGLSSGVIVRLLVFIDFLGVLLVTVLIADLEAFTLGGGGGEGLLRRLFDLADASLLGFARVLILLL